MVVARGRAMAGVAHGGALGRDVKAPVLGTWGVNVLCCVVLVSVDRLID